MGIVIPDLSGALAVLATIGLVLIVLEGSLELEIDRSKIGLVSKSFVGAFFSILILSFSFALVFQYVSNQPLKVLLINAIPLSIISSAIAIPSVKNLSASNREFVTYESSLSDII
jgi:Kef-type K+ transport system membrane component KefB